MKDDSLNMQEPKTLLKLLKVGRETEGAWGPGDLGAILRHQLAAPLSFDLAETADAREGEAPSEPQSPGLARSPALPQTPGTFADALHGSGASVELLGLIKDFAKSAGDEREGGLPREVATLLYYLSIAAALVHHGMRITSLNDEGLRQGMSWALGQGWIDEKTRGVLREGLARVEG